MANYCAVTRSNYFKVKNTPAFENHMSRIGLEVRREVAGGDHYEGEKCMIYEGEGNGWPSYDPEEEEEFDLLHIISEHLVHGEVAILFEIGNEKLRYLLGRATAVNSEGETRQVDLFDIYTTALEIGAGFTHAEY